MDPCQSLEKVLMEAGAQCWGEGQRLPRGTAHQGSTSRDQKYTWSAPNFAGPCFFWKGNVRGVIDL